MRTTLDLDPDLIAEAQRVTGISRKIDCQIRAGAKSIDDAKRRARGGHPNVILFFGSTFWLKTFLK